MEDEGVSLGNCTTRLVTARAVLVLTPDFGEQWIPLSNLHDDSDIYGMSRKGDAGDVVIKSWFAEKKGWA